MKIPTLLGIALLITLISLAGLYFYFSPEQSQENFEVKNLEVVNITDTSATVVWQTEVPTIGEVLYGENEANLKSAGDARDLDEKRERLTHFINIADLEPEKVYKYKLKNNGSASNDYLEFKTAGTPADTDELTFSFAKPLQGTILNTNLNPVDESLVFLDIPGAGPLAAFSSTSGNFVLSLKTVFDQELNKLFIIPNDTKAVLRVVKGDLNSEVKINISDKSMTLPPITIGTNLDLEEFEVQPINQITFSTVPAIGGDFNGDQRVNSLDLALLKEAASQEGNTQSNFDINKDGIVDLDDVNEFSASLAR